MGAPLAGHIIAFALLSVARIETPPLQPAAVFFVPYSYVLVRVRVLASLLCYGLKAKNNQTRALEYFYVSGRAAFAAIGTMALGSKAPCKERLERPETVTR